MNFMLVYFNTPFFVTDRTSRQKIPVDTEGLNNIVNLLDLIDISRAYHPTHF